jgi:hypothetical protein
VSAAERAHIERLVTRIQNENLLHSKATVPTKQAGEACFELASDTVQVSDTS